MADAVEPTADFDDVYLGFWTNWAKGSVRGVTLTTTRESGGLLIAFLAIFVGTAGRSFWRISCLIIHRLLSSEAAHDALFHQRQVLLRNSSTPIQAIKELFYMMLAWRSSAPRYVRRLLTLFLWAMFVSLAFSAAGLFASRVTTDTASEVLLNGDKCRVRNPFADEDDYQNQLAFFLFMSQATASHVAYAQRCYMGAGNPTDCQQYVKPRIPLNVTRGQPCPFEDKMCKSPAMTVDTGLMNSNMDLGLNLPSQHQFNLKVRYACAPIHSDNYTSIHNQTRFPALPLVKYHLGKSFDPDADYIYQASWVTSAGDFYGWEDTKLFAPIKYDIG